MNIGIDARMVGSGYGIGRYVEQLLIHLSHAQTTHRFIIFVRNEIGKKYVPSSERFHVVQADIPWYSYKEQIQFARILSAEQLDLVHFPHWNIPILYRKPFVMTLHDLTMFHFSRPEATTRSRILFFMKDHAHRLVIRKAVTHTRHIITTSNFTRNDIHTTLGVPFKKMTTVYQAPFLVHIPKTDKSVLKKYTILKPYLLYVGAAYPHKNLEGLLSAWKIYQEKYGMTYCLVLVGQKNYFYTRIIKKSISEKINNVLYTGLVHDEELIGLYDHARAFVFPSIYEGFGLPSLEAMARGIPVLSSNRSCLPEILSTAALYTNPEAIDQFATAINQIITNENIRYTLRQNAKHELHRYSWGRSIQQILKIYDTALIAKK